ncbi:DUF421 domain-containing protein [Paenibacillus marinisediminis]
MNPIIEITLRSILAFGVMMVITRLLGKATITQMTYHDFVAAITLGAITGNLAFNIKMSMWQLLIALIVYSGIAYVLMRLAMSSRPIRKWVSGQPTVLIQEGKILENNMRNLKFTLDTLNQELREKNIFNIEEVEYAVLELNGKVSVLRKQEYLPVLRKDLNLPSNTKQLFPIELIMDGVIIEDNLQVNHIDIAWLLKQVKKQGLSVEEVNYAVKSSNGHIYFDPYKDKISHTVDKE